MHSYWVGPWKEVADGIVNSVSCESVEAEYLGLAYGLLSDLGDSFLDRGGNDGDLSRFIQFRIRLLWREIEKGREPAGKMMLGLNPLLIAIPPTIMRAVRSGEAARYLDIALTLIRRLREFTDDHWLEGVRKSGLPDFLNASRRLRSYERDLVERSAERRRRVEGRSPR